MRKIFLFISLWGLFGTGLFVPSVLLASESTFSGEITSPDEETFRLHSLLATGQMRSPSSSPFEVTITWVSITIDFFVPLDKVHVEITDTFGQVVYSHTANAEPDTQWLIDMSDWKIGSYTFSLTDSSGNCIDELFEISN